MYMKVYHGIWRYMRVYESIWRYMMVYEGIWRYMNVVEGIWRFLFLFFCFFWFSYFCCSFRGYTGPGRHPLVFVMNFQVECTQNHVWGPPGARVMSISIKTCICGKDALGRIHDYKEHSKIYRMVFAKYKTLELWSALWG